MTNEQIIELVEPAGLTYVPYGKVYNLIILGTKDKLIDHVYIQWFVGMSHVYVGVSYSTTPIEQPCTNFPIVDELIKVDGIVQINIVPYLIAVVKAESFTMAEFIPSVVDAWKTYQLKKEFDYEQPR